MSVELLDDLLADAARVHPERPAVIDGERTLTYSDLDRAANRLAQGLRTICGIVGGDRVGLHLDKSLESLVAIYGILRAGAAYVPLDPSAPGPRIATIAADAELSVIVAGPEKADFWPLLATETPLRALVVPGADADSLTAPAAVQLIDAQALAAQSPEPPERQSRSVSDLAYVLYTSGSTGVPKGVMLSHANALAFVDWAVGEFAVRESDRLSSHAPLHFDLSIFDIFAAAQAGAAVVLVPEGLALFPVTLTRWIDDYEITVWYSVPSILTLLVLRGKIADNPPAALRTVLFAGEVFPTKHLKALMGALPGVRFANLYGPTETNVCTWYEVAPWEGDDPESIPIGKPITGDEAVAVREDGTPAERGEVGELWITGATVMQGYWGDEQRTQATLTRRDGGVNTYRTGDLARLDADGNWIYLGRRDAQIKSRGYRIELGDIEATLNSHPEIVECAVVAVPDEVVTNRIAAFVVVRGDVSAQDLTSFCSGRLPPYMAPEEYTFQDELPRSSTGKIDRQALAAHAGVRAASQR